MINDARRTQVLAIVLAVAILTSSIAAVSMRVGDAPAEPSPTRPADLPDPTAQIRTLHDAGVTGENVSVGVVVATGVNPNEASFATQVVARRAFAPNETIHNGGQNDHGTATAALVSQVAPDADLYLASFDRAGGFERAMKWLQSEQVDVIVAPIAFYGRPGNGSSAVARVAADVASSGVTVVAPVGNIGQGHWQGEFTPNADGRHRFSGGTRNYLQATNGQRLAMWVAWRGIERPESNFTIELYRQVGDAARLVARSRPFEGDAWPNEMLTARLDPSGTYYVEIRGPPNASGTHLELSSPTHTLQYRERGGSVVAPATARAVVAVGAYNARTGTPRPFSSAGPIDGKRPGVDVIAPDGQRVAGADSGFVGTSGASAYTAGVVALMLATNPDLRPTQVEAILEVTAAAAGAEGVDPVTGSGRLVPRRAVTRARNVTG